MLALELCGVALTYLSALPTPLWTQATQAAYHCPVELVQTQKVEGLQPLETVHRQPGGAWRVMTLDHLSEARAGDGLLLPPQPTSLLLQPEVLRRLRDVQSKGSYLILDLPDARQLPAVATTYLGWGLKPSAAFLRRAPDHWNDLPAGTFLMSDIGGLALLPRVAQLNAALTQGEKTVTTHAQPSGAIQLVPYLPDATGGSYAAPQVDANTLRLNPSLTWIYAGQQFSSRISPESSWQQLWLTRLMPLVWVVGSLLNSPRPSLIYTASSSVAWVLLALLVLTLLALARALLQGQSRKQVSV